MKFILLLLSFIFISSEFYPQQIKLNPPSDDRGYSVMKSLSLRASASDYDTSALKLQDLSDLLWAANGINRPESGKRTAPSAINAQDIDVYAVMKEGVYLYNAKQHSLDFVAEGDKRDLAAGSQINAANASVILLLVSDISRFSRGSNEGKMVWAAEDAGIVSQNISLFCASVGLSTRPRATMDKQKLSEALKLKDTQHLMLNHPVGY
jgi:SagB-type dehydrogenase family enzyme